MSERKLKKCFHCGSLHDEDHMMEYDGNFYCEDCFYDNFGICAICGNVEPLTDIFYVESEDKHICRSCKDAHYRVCFYCGELVFRWDVYYLDGEYCCECCYENNAYHCDCCGEDVSEVRWDFDRECCCDCASRIIGSYHSHNFRKIGSTCIEENIFHKGVELEVENVGGNISNDELALKIYERYKELVFEHDGSLDDGFEIITQPHTFEKFKEIPWKSILAVCASNGFRSHDTSTCGLHIHYSREFFGLNRYEQEDNIGKLIAFYERNLKDLLRMSRRTWGEYERWARGYDTEGDVERCKDCAKRGNDRYHYINMNNYSTIEFRLGRGTLNYESFMAWNNFHDCLVKNVKNVSYEDIDNYAVWLDGIDCDTIRYLIARNCFGKVVEMYKNMEV